MSRTLIDHAEWMLRTVAKANKEGCSNGRSWAELWEDSYKEVGGRSMSVGQKGCPKNAAYGLWLLGRVKGAGRVWLDISVSDVNKEHGKNAAYAVLAVDILAEGNDYDVQQLWQRVKLLYLAATGEAPASKEQGQIRLVLALSKRGALGTGKCAAV
jgi:hypothetical protein